MDQEVGLNWTSLQEISGVNFIWAQVLPRYGFQNMRNDSPCTFLFVSEARCLASVLEEKDNDIQAVKVTFSVS